jgi:hypothetical protein
MFDQNTITRTMLVDLAKERDLREIDNRDIPTDPDNWTDSLIVSLAIKQFLEPNAGHLRADLLWLKIGGRFRLSDNEWQVTDIGTRTLSAIKIDDKVRADPSLLNGPSYAVAEHLISFDEDDFEIIEKV